MKNIENIVNTEVRSIEDLILENEALMARNEFLEKAISVLKRDNERITSERNQLVDKLHRPMTNTNSGARFLENGVNTILGDDY